MIIEIDDKLLSSDLFTECFVCDYETCAGVCCVHGDSGAPLSAEEQKIIEENIEIVKSYMQAEGVKAIEKQGAAVIDSDGDLVTPLINGEECVYTLFDEKGNCFCAIERAYLDGKINFQKPISCHLYPIRVKQIGDKTALNYDRWSICQCARDKGLSDNVKVYQFLKTPIIRQFGEDFYKELEKVDELLKEQLK